MVDTNYGTRDQPRCSLPTDWNDLERFEPRLLLATECFVSLFSALHVDL